ncbi:hypothetical protein GCM10023116_19160 [Kistimonas scapharcae]|uniref:Uncharacterized protein n=1 Tax=Kistimonas scapharcae TaxID=1036133 RepID=A0ABP8V3K8_9GAMM
MNLSLEEVPSITVLSQRIDFIGETIPDDDMACRLLMAYIATRLDIEISAYYLSSNVVHELERQPDRPQPEQRPPLVNYFTRPLAHTVSERIRALREYFHLTIPGILADLNTDETDMPVALTGSMAFQHYILSIWDDESDSTLQHLYEQAGPRLPEGINQHHMQACMTPRDTDLTVLNHSQFNSIVQWLKKSLEKARMDHWELANEMGSVIIRGHEEAIYLGKVITTDRLTVMGTGAFPENIHYVIDVTMGSYPDQPSPDHYTTVASGGSHIHIRRMDDIILDELNCIQTQFAGCIFWFT